MAKSTIVRVDDIAEHVSTLRDKIVKELKDTHGDAQWHAKICCYSSYETGDCDVTEFRYRDRVWDMIVVTRNDFNHCEVVHLRGQ